MIVLALLITMAFISSDMTGSVDATDYMEHETICINNYTELQTWIVLNVTGTGTEMDPHIIQGLDITGDGEITVAFSDNIAGTIIIAERDGYRTLTTNVTVEKWGTVDLGELTLIEEVVAASAV
jgi:hypothetical protein